MSLVFAAISPHPPLLIPSIGKDELKKISKTKQALERMEEDLYLSKPDIVLIISPHGSYFSDAFTLNINAEYETDLREFGDLTTKLKFKGELDISSYIREKSKDQNFPTAVISEKKIDHGAAVPLYYLTPHLPNISLIPIGFSNLDWKTHINFGYMIKECIANTNKRVAVIASGDLSHALKTEAPAGYNPAGHEFDKKIQELLAANNISGMMQMDKQFIADAAECGFRSFLILMGILKNTNYNFSNYSYEGPFGVGYLTANFILN